jgi:hypothetical protein
MQDDASEFADTHDILKSQLFAEDEVSNGVEEWLDVFRLLTESLRSVKLLDVFFEGLHTFQVKKSSLR